MRKLLYVCALAMVAGACSSDELAPVGPDPQGCTKGSIQVGDTKTGSIGASSCAMYDWYWEEDSVNFESYNVTVEKGKGYLFTLSGDEPAERELGLVSRNSVNGDSASIYLAVQEAYDEANPSQIYFVAPVTGTYSLRVFNDEVGDSFDYTLTARECTPRAIDIGGAYANDTASLSSDDCTLEEPYFNWMSREGVWSYAPSHVALYTVYMNGYSPRKITVQSDDFAPSFMLEGPGFDGWCNTYYCSGDNFSNGSMQDSVTTTWWMWMPGTYTLAIGSMEPNATGNFKVTISEPLGSDELALRLPPDFTQLQSGQHKKMTGPR